MILRRLAEFADRISNLPPSMYSSLAVKWQIELDRDGRFLGLTPLSDGSKKNRGLNLMTPNLKRSGTAPPPLLLADKATYVLGLGAGSPEESWHFGEFRKLVVECAEKTKEPTVEAVATFLAAPFTIPAKIPADIEAGDLVCFRVGDVRPTDLPEVRRFWVAKNASDDGVTMQCVVCGESGPVDKVSPVAIKGMAGIGGQSSGMAVVSGNKDAFLSYGAEQALIAPTCRACGEAYANSINYMIGTERHRIFIGPAVFLFWTRGEQGFSPVSFLSQPQEEDVRALINSSRTGRAASPGTVEGDEFYAISMSASGGRVAVRDWLETTVPAVQENLARWFLLQRITDTDRYEGKYYGAYALGASLYLKPNDQMVANVPRTLVRCALYGGPLPDWLLAQAVGRNRAERTVTRNRAALIKAVIASQMDELPKEGYLEMLDSNCTSHGYLCGRLLAELESAQKAAINPNTTLVDRYYGAASSSPAVVFGSLLRGLQPHMAKLRRDRRGAFNAIDGRLQDILSSMGEFPKVLNLKEQAMFALGYYHQKAANRSAAASHSNDNTHNAEEQDEVQR